MYNYHKASEHMKRPPKSADHRYDVRFTFTSYFLTQAFRPDTPPTTHSLSDPAVAFHFSALLLCASCLRLCKAIPKASSRVQSLQMLHSMQSVDAQSTIRLSTVNVLLVYGPFDYLPLPFVVHTTFH